jgi:small redox-active disulfide protein 2
MICIKVLGPGCGNCQRLAQIAQQAANNLGVEAQIQKLTEYKDFMKYQILMTPGLVINEKVVCAGRVPSAAEVTTWIANSVT